ncbi:chemotaxis protein CheW [Pacificimonas sp. WHA3]|uniref:Chemotaxis protein CheW n=1 Tax=Pacificimonas pallii TaxID=2827236 RepID=A0ABS6SB78_9SPHN|nr:chemotaxis protein CheW [Pacificimonas pallii]MBV7255181.1 chemotaxis protein CheW [Pacificimonas pallii]
MSQLVNMKLAGTSLGIDVKAVQDVVRLGSITPVPRAADWIAGMMNLRGHIVTAINMRARMNLPPADPDARQMCVVVNLGPEAYSLIVDSVGEVISVTEDQREPEPATLDSHWRSVSRGVVRLPTQLLIEIDIEHLIRGKFNEAA